MNIVFDFGNVLVEWNPARLIEFHYAAADGRAHFPEALADTLIKHVLPVHDSAVALMQELADGQHGGHRVLYLSNMPVAFADVLEARCPWIARFESGIFSGRVNLAKPDDAIFAAAEQTLGLNPAETLFLDDSVRNVHAARARGWQAAVIDSPHSVQHGVLNLP